MTGKENEVLLSLSEIITSTKGILFGNRNVSDFNFKGITSVQTDSRFVKEDSLFVPLIGENQNGHIYIPSAIKNGACVVFVNKKETVENPKAYNQLALENKNVAFVVVENTLFALQDSAAFYVQKFPNLIKVALTGSSGKTTTKEMIVSVLKQKYDVVCTQGNFNSETGLPLSVFNIRKNHQVGVFEMGMNRVGELEEISRVLKAPYAAITNIGTAHIGILGSRENIAKEKRHVFDFVKKGGIAFVPNEDDFRDFLEENVKTRGGKIIHFGNTVSSSVSGVSFVKDLGLYGTEFSVGTENVHLKIPGVYNYRNALCACAIGKELGLSDKQIKQGLENLSSVNGRMETSSFLLKEKDLNKKRKITIIKDFYNANPDSMGAAISFIKEMESKNRKVLVIGDMRELGKESLAEHKKAAFNAVNSGASLVLFCGNEMKAGFEEVSSQIENSIKTEWVSFSDEDSIKKGAEILLDYLQDEDVVLFKASRGLALERILPYLGEENG